MDGLDQACRGFVHTFLSRYFETPEDDAILEMLDENVELLGAGPAGGSRFSGGRPSCCSAKQRRAGVADAVSWKKTTGRPPWRWRKACAWWDARCVVRKEQGPAAAPHEIRLYLSALCCTDRTGAIRLRRLHLSVPIATAREGGTFPGWNVSLENDRLRRQLEEQSRDLRRKTRDMETLAVNLPVGILCCAHTAERDILEYSQGFLRMFGYTEADIEDTFHRRFLDMGLRGRPERCTRIPERGKSCGSSVPRETPGWLGMLGAGARRNRRRGSATGWCSIRSSRTSRRRNRHRRRCG